MLISVLKNLNMSIWYLGKKEVNVRIGNVRINRFIKIWMIVNIILMYKIGKVRINKFVMFI